MENYKINSEVLTFNRVLHVETYGDDATGDGSALLPFASFVAAEKAAVAGDAIVFGKGDFALQCPYADQYGAPFIRSAKSIVVIGQGLKTVLYCDAITGHTGRDACVFGGSITAAYKLNIKYIPYGTSNYNNAVFDHCTTTLYNVAIDNISSSKSISMNYYNGGTGGSLVNCIIKSNGRYVGDYSGKCVLFENTLFDWNYTNVSTVKNKVVRTITDDDYTRGNNVDLMMSDGSVVGVYGGLYTWRNWHLLYSPVGATSVYGMQNSTFAKLADDWSALTDTEKVDLFKSTNYEIASAADLATLGKFKVLMYAEDDEQQTLSLTAVPHDQLALPKGLISLESFDGIDKATLTSTISGSGVCKLLVTTDGTTYQTYDFTAQTWQAVDHTDLSAVKASGIDAAALSAIDRTAWDALTTGKTGIGFAYFLSIEDTADTCAVDQLDLQVDMRGSWDKAVHGTDYKYGYPLNHVLRVQLLADGDYKINYQG